MCSLKFTVMFW